MNSFGTDEYIENIVESYSLSLLKTAYAILRNTQDAEDAVQETFLKLIKKQPFFKDKNHEKAWLLRVTINNAKNILRFSKRSDIEYNENFVTSAAERSDILNEVLSLPEKYRTVIHLYYYDGYSIKEIAKILCKPQATVGTILARGRKMLKLSLEGD